MMLALVIGRIALYNYRSSVSTNLELRVRWRPMNVEQYSPMSLILLCGLVHYASLVRLGMGIFDLMIHQTYYLAVSNLVGLEFW